MKFIALLDIQGAVFRTLSQDPEYRALSVGGIYDGELPPENQQPTYPYTVLDSFIETGHDRLSTTGRLVSFLVHVFSQYEGTTEGSQLLSSAIGLLNRRKLVAGDWNITDLQFMQANSLVQPDNNRHFFVRFHATCQPIL